MKEREVRIGGRYEIRIGGRTAVVRILGTAVTAGPRRRWVARTEDTRRTVRITAARLRRELGDGDESLFGARAE
jgi:hypothetical protein